MNIPSETRRDVLEWCKYHFENNLVGLAFFDPAPVDDNYPSGDLNLLIVVHVAPEETRERYELVTQMLVRNLAPSQTMTCRVQTAGELNLLAQMRLPLLAIYLHEAEIIYDPQKVLTESRSTLTAK